MAIHCPHCEKPMNCGSEVRMFGQRWHMECWIPWLEFTLDRDKKLHKLGAKYAALYQPLKGLPPGPERDAIEQERADLSEQMRVIRETKPAVA